MIFDTRDYMPKNFYRKEFDIRLESFFLFSKIFVEKTFNFYLKMRLHRKVAKINSAQAFDTLNYSFKMFLSTIFLFVFVILTLS